MNILGISAFYHDSAACLMVDGRIVAAAQEERFTRQKHDFNFPTRAVAYCLETAGLSVEELDVLAFYDKPFLKFERLVESYLSYAPRGLRSFTTSVPIWIKQKLFMRRELLAGLPGFRGKLLFTGHHEAHAASAFFPSPFESAAVLTADGVGEWTTTSIGVGEGNQVRLLKELHYPHSLGLLYSAFTYYTGFRVNSGEYKLMGLAPYGEPRYADLIREHLIDIRPDGSFALDMRYFNYVAGLTMTTARFHKLFGGPPRRPDTPPSQKDMDLAASIQQVTEEVMLKLAIHAHEITGKSHLCLAGGVALNCVANGRILREGPFEDIWIQPASGDAGGALGAALIAHFIVNGQPRHITPGHNPMQQASYLGPDYDADTIREFLDAHGCVYERLDMQSLPDTVAGLIASEQVVGWFQGRMEFGPRALGSRSILGDARSRQMQSVMNLKIKYRESFRPFAPSVLVEKAPEWFEIDRPSPYMLLTTQIREDKRLPLEKADLGKQGLEKLKLARSLVPAITHVDYSARLQTVSKADNPLYHALIQSFYDKTGCPVIINTSFNVRGEPIVCSPKDAYACFMRTDMDYLVLGPYLLDKTRQPPLPDTAEWRRDFRPD